MATGTWVPTADLSTEAEAIKKHIDLQDVFVDEPTTLHSMGQISGLSAELNRGQQWEVDHLAVENPHNIQQTEEYLIGDIPPDFTGVTPQKYLNTSTGVLYRHGGDGNGSGFAFDGTRYATITPQWESLGDNSVYANVTYAGNVGLVLSLPVNTIGTGYVGTASNLSLKDKAPIQGVSVAVGNNARYVDLDQYMILTGTFDISFNWIRKNASATRTCIMGNGSTQGIFICDTDNAKPNAIQVTTSTGTAEFLTALEGRKEPRAPKALNKQVAIRIARDSLNVIRAWVDNVPHANEPVLAGTITVNSFGKGVAGEFLNTDSALNSVRITDSSSRLWDFPLDDNNGTTVANDSETTKHLGWLTNSQIYSNNIDSGPSTPPPIRQNIIFTSGWEDMANGPLTTRQTDTISNDPAIDSWVRKHNYLEIAGPNDMVVGTQASLLNISANTPVPLSGSKMLRVCWKKAWPPDINGEGNYALRCELQSPGGTRCYFRYGQTYWQGWAIFFPDTVAQRSAHQHTLATGINIQWHDVGGGVTQGFHIKKSSVDNTVVWMFEWGNSGKRLMDGEGGNALIPVEFGIWNKFVIQASIGSAPNAPDGFIKIWLNAANKDVAPIVHWTGLRFPWEVHPQMGLYRGYRATDADPYKFGTADEIEWFYDEYRVGSATSDFDSVKPGA